MSEKRKFIIECAAVLCLTVCLLLVSSNLMEKKDSKIKYADFFAQKEPFDVLFFGSSHVMNGIFPMELWKDYGIVSYNFGGNGSRLPTTYWTLENALEYTEPKVVVIDCLLLSANEKCAANFSQLHQSFDAFPLSVTKIKAALDLLDETSPESSDEEGTSEMDLLGNGTEPRTKIGLLWDYSVYHSRWSELEENDFRTAISPEKGAQSRNEIVRGNLEKISPDEISQPDTVGEIYLRKIIEECRARHIDVLLTYLPFPARAWEQREANRAFYIAREYNLKYLNFLDMDVINYQTDLCDANSHLNSSGARKVTAYLGAYLKEYYNVSDHRGEAAYAFWEEDYAEYTQLKNENLRKQKSLVQFLTLLGGDELDYVIDIRKPETFQNTWITTVLKNINIPTEELGEDTRFVLHGASGETCVLPELREGEPIETSCGTVCLIGNASGTPGSFSLTLDDEEICAGDQNDDTAMQITVRRNGVSVDMVRFQYNVNRSTKVLESIKALREEDEA